jgi:hypothetical protein
VGVYLVAHLKAMRNAHKTVGKQKNGVRIQIVLKGIFRIQVYMTTLRIRVSSVMPRAPTDGINLYNQH